MNSKLLSVLFTSLFILISSYGKSQSPIKPGDFTFKGTKFEVSELPDNEEELLITPKDGPEISTNPEEINGTSTEEILRTLEIHDSYDYDSLLPLFSNYENLKNDGEYIQMVISTDGQGVINKILFYLDSKTKISQQDLGKFYQKLKKENKIELKSKDNKHVNLKFIVMDKSVKFNPDFTKDDQ